MCDVLLPPGVNPTAVKYIFIISYQDTVLFQYGEMITSDATLDISRIDGVFIASVLYTLEIHNTKSWLITTVGFVSYTGDLRTSEQKLISFHTSYPEFDSVTSFCFEGMLRILFILNKFIFKYYLFISIWKDINFLFDVSRAVTGSH
jgi:hypothetical protein